MSFENLIVNFLNRRVKPSCPGDPTAISLGRRSEMGHQELRWPALRRFEHAAVLGHSGSGKTHFLEFLAAQHMQRGEGFAFFDFHGDATEHLLAIVARHQDVADKVVLIDPTDSRFSPGLNPLESDADHDAAIFMKASELASILRQRWQVEAFGARTEELLRNTLFTLASHGFTLVEVPLLLTSKNFRTQLTATLNHPDIIEYWRDRYEPLSEPMKATFREALLNKITGFLTEPSTRHLLGQSRSTINFSEAMARGSWLLINLAKGRLREHSHTLGNLLFAQLQFAVMARVDLPPERRRLFTIFCDEAQNLAENDLMTLFAEGRKFGVSLITANQYWEQLPRELRATLLSAGTHVLFRLSAADAGVLAGELSVTLRSKYHVQLTQLARGEAVVRIGPGAPELIRVPRLPDMRHVEVAAAQLRSLSTERYMRPRSEVEALIQSRRVEATKPPAATNPDATEEGQQHW